MSSSSSSSSAIELSYAERCQAAIALLQDIQLPDHRHHRAEIENNELQHDTAVRNEVDCHYTA